MKMTIASIMALLSIAVVVVAQQTAMQTSDTEMRAIANLRKFAMPESAYAMGHSEEGFACNPEVLTKLEWPGSPTHNPLVIPALLSGTAQYKFSAQCVGTLKPAGKLNVFAVPLDAKAGLRTSCATGTFQTKPFLGTSEFPIRSITAGTGENCLASRQALR
jgi:hypothetical protein